MRLILLPLAVFVHIFLYSQANESYLIVGTFTKPKANGEGIYVYKFNNITGASTFVTKINTDNPGYLAISNNQQFIYAVNQNGVNKVNEVSSFRFNSSDGSIVFLNKQVINGVGPCYVTTNQNNTWLVVANYTSGSINLLPIDSLGWLQPVKQVIQHSGSSLHKTRQATAHTHAVVFDKAENYLLATDLGNDKLYLYAFDSSNKHTPLQLDSSRHIPVKPGNGPRHAVFTKKHVYVVNELAGTIDVFKYRKGKAIFLQCISTDTTVALDKASADIQVSKDEKFLYVTNRAKYNTVATFAIKANGKLRFVNVQSTSGKTPRNLVINATNNFVLVANQDSNNIVVFKRDTSTGLLTNTHQDIIVPSAVCLKFIAPH